MLSYRERTSHQLPPLYWSKGTNNDLSLGLLNKLSNFFFSFIQPQSYSNVSEYIWIVEISKDQISIKGVKNIIFGLLLQEKSWLFLSKALTDNSINQMGTNSNQKCSLLFLAEQIGVKLGRLGSYDILLPCRLDAIFLSESRNLYQQNLSLSAIYFRFQSSKY